MGEIELDTNQQIVLIHSNIITYGNASGEKITEQMRDEIETMWNEPHAVVVINKLPMWVVFRVSAQHRPDIDPTEILENTNPRNNYFRIEEFALGNISFVDGLGSNSGYFKLENLYVGSTTAAHEYGHTLGLDHPRYTDIRGEGQPGIMYPRGTWVDPIYQYDQKALPGEPGGTMHPMYRRVLQSDIDLLRLNRYRFNNSFAVLGDFSNVYHPDHADINQGGGAA